MRGWSDAMGDPAVATADGSGGEDRDDDPRALALSSPSSSRTATLDASGSKVAPLKQLEQQLREERRIVEQKLRDERRQMKDRQKEELRALKQRQVDEKQRLMATPEEEEPDDEEAADEGDEESKWKLASRVQTYVSSTTFHGLDMVVSTSEDKERSCKSRFFWAILMVSVFVVVTLQLHTLVNAFIANPTLTKIAVIYPEEGLEIPPLTVCTLTKLNATAIKTQFPKVTKTLAEFSTSSFISAYSTSLMDFQFFERQNLTNTDLQQQLADALGDTSFTDYLNATSFQCRDQFLLCWFENGGIWPCCDPDNGLIIVEKYLLHSGPCFTFRATKDIRQRLPGPVGGFGFVYWYPNQHILKSAFNSYDEHAVHLFMSPADAMLEKNPIALPVGYHNHISLSATKTHRLKTDQLGRSICFQKTLRYFSEYSYENCQVECHLEAMLEQCQCIGVATYSQISPSFICPPTEALICYDTLAYNFTDVLVECRKKECQEACDYWSYTAGLTVGKVFNPALEMEMLKYWRLPEGNPSLSLIIADVYFHQIQYTDVQEMPAVTVESFVSNIGGALGLWTGASIITWIHLIYFCLASFCHNRRRRKQRQAERQRRLLDALQAPLVTLAKRNSQKSAAGTASSGASDA